MTRTLLVELLSEELPPKALAKLGQAFANGLTEGLRARQFLSATSQATGYATSRRLAVSISDVLKTSPDRPLREKILPVSVALDASGNATAPLTKKLAAMNLVHLTVADLERAVDGKAEAFFYSHTAPGKALAAGLQEALAETLARLPIPKVMTYQLHAGTAQEKEVQFVRPAHSLIALFGDAVVAVSALGLEAGRSTLGHRFLSDGAITIRHADDYARALHEEGRVVASFEERRDVIREELTRVAGTDETVMPDALLDEVTALVEWPAVYAGRFDEAFLDVPQECLILTMQQNQKYFALTDAAGKMRNRFLLVSNIETGDASAIVGGNERVLRARLADAKFFFDQDRKKTLESRLPGLASVVYHNQLGNQAERMARVTALATRIATLLGSDPVKAERAARLAKADLLTDMVGEFPELQGLMGQYYARHDGEDDEVAQAIEEHYRPRFAGDALPRTQAGTAVALADKLETLCGMFGIGNVPTGDKDPFGLRRHALGVLRILIEKSLDLSLAILLSEAELVFAHVSAYRSKISVDGVEASTTFHLKTFILERARGLLRDCGYTSNEVEAVLSLRSTQEIPPSEYLLRLDAVRFFWTLAEAPALAEADKRIRNIIAKSGEAIASRAIPDQFVLPAEVNLFNALILLRPKVEQFMGMRDYPSAIGTAAAIHQPVTAFFAEVLVNDPDHKQNRLALLSEVARLTNCVANISKLAA